MANLDTFTANAAKFASTFDKGDKPLPPARKALVIACMDARLHPEKILGLEIGDAHVVRNAGGRAVDALRSVIISQRLLGTKEVYIIHHTDCGMLLFTDSDLVAKVKEDTGADVSGQHFHPFSDLEQSVRDDVAAVKGHPAVPKDIPVVGFVYDVKTGKLARVE